MLYIFKSIFVSHLAALVVMTFLKLDESRLRSALLLTGEFLLLAFQFLHKVKKQNSIVRSLMRCGCVALALLIPDSDAKFFVAGSCMQHFLTKDPIVFKILNCLGHMFYFIMFGGSQMTIIVGVLISLLMVINVLTKYHSKVRAIPKLNTPINIPDNSQRASIREYQSQPSEGKLHMTDQFKKIFDSFPDGIVMVYTKKEVFFINKKIREMMGVNNKKRAFNRLMALRNVQTQITELENLQKILEEKRYMQQVSVELELENKTYFQKSFDESKYEELSSEYKSTVHQTSQSFDSVRQTLDFMVQPHILDRSSKKMLCSSDDLNNSLFQVNFKKFVQIEKNDFILIIVRDVTQFNQISTLKKSLQDKSQLLSTVAHEFRTPLSSIKLLIEQIKPKCSEEMMTKCIRPVLSQVDCFIYMIQDMLDASQMNAGKFKLNLQFVDINTLVQDIYKIMVVLAEQKQNELQIQQNLPTQIYNDHYKIRQILINLIGNAIKFTQNGIIQIGGKQISPTHTEMWVIDNGQGIAENNQQRLFKAFGKLEDPTNINPQGVGLGLMICNAIAKELSGPQSIGLKVVSEGEGKGSKFIFTIFDFQKSQTYQQESIFRQQRMYFLPPENQVKKFDSQRMSELDVSQYYQKCQCADILIVDDDQFIRNALKQQFESKGFRTQEAQNGDECIKKVKNFPTGTCGCRGYKMIVLDVNMPGMSGIEITKKLIAYGFSGSIIGHSGYSEEKEKQECLQAGMKAYFTKPCKIENLLGWAQKAS